MEIKASIKNGRLIIESNTDEGSALLDKWINENKTFLNKNLDIEILAHDKLKKPKNIVNFDNFFDWWEAFTELAYSQNLEITKDVDFIRDKWHNKEFSIEAAIKKYTR